MITCGDGIKATPAGDTSGAVTSGSLVCMFTTVSRVANTEANARESGGLWVMRESVLL